MGSVPAKLTASGALYQPAAVGGASRSRRHLRRSGVVLDHDGARSDVAGEVAAGSTDRGGGGVGPRVRLRRVARGEPRGCVASGVADRERMVVPAVDVRRTRGRGGRLRRRLVVLRREERGGALVAGLVDAGSGQRDGRIVRPRVGRLGTGGDAGGAVDALEGDRDRVVVPAVRIRRPRGGVRLRRRLVVLERQRRRCGVPCDIAACSSDGGSARVGPAVRSVRGTRLETGSRVVPVEVDGDVVVVPAVRVGGARRGCVCRRRGLVDLERLGDRRLAAVALSRAGQSRALSSRVLSDRVSQPVVERMIDSGSTTVQLTVVLVVYHPASPRVPVIAMVTTGGVGSPGTFGRPAAPGVRSSAVTASRKTAACRRTPWPYFVTTNELLPSGRFA